MIWDETEEDVEERAEGVGGSWMEDQLDEGYLDEGLLDILKKPFKREEKLKVTLTPHDGRNIRDAWRTETEYPFFVNLETGFELQVDEDGTMTELVTKTPMGNIKKMTGEHGKR